MFWRVFSRAARHNEQGNELSAKGSFTEAEAAYRRAAEADPRWSVPWYNLGLMFKKRRQWLDSLIHTKRATELDPSETDGWWNLGIAATALGEWKIAREAWRVCGVENVPEGEGPIEMDLGPVPVRLHGPAEGEVVWGQRIDPARVVLVSVPLPKSGYHWQDVVLHDGAPSGYRMLQGRRVPVFDVLQRMSVSGFGTFVAELKAPDQAEIKAIETVAHELGGAAEDWSTTVQSLCERCSQGTPHELHDADRRAPSHPYCGIAARDEAHVQAILAAWSSQAPRGQVLRWYRTELTDA